MADNGDIRQGQVLSKQNDLRRTIMIRETITI